MNIAAETPLPAPADEHDAPPVRTVTPGEWVRANLFNSWLNSILTVVFGVFLAWLTFQMARFVFVTADWEIVRRNLRLFMIGRFPSDELWRPWAATYAVGGVVGLISGTAARIAEDESEARGAEAASSDPLSWLRRFWAVILLLVVVLSFTRSVLPTLLTIGAVGLGAAVRAGTRRLPRSITRWTWVAVLLGLYLGLQLLQGCGRQCGWDKWGGIHLTLFVTVGGILLAFPIGLLLALGRRSSMPAIKALSISYIEAFRGVPLITLLLMGQFVIGFFLPAGFDRPAFITRAMIAITIFESAYVAEIVRGGLNAVPKGQYEAAQALGLGHRKVMQRVVLPQALRAVIPATVGQFISLYKDTSLLSILGLFELLNVAQSVTTQPDFLAQGLAPVTLGFAAFLYWVGSYTMSRESQRLERRLGVGER